MIDARPEVAASDEHVQLEQFKAVMITLLELISAILTQQALLFSRFILISIPL
jgi:hypothetical protein